MTEKHSQHTYPPPLQLPPAHCCNELDCLHCHEDDYGEMSYAWTVSKPLQQPCPHSVPEPPVLTSKPPSNITKPEVVQLFNIPLCGLSGDSHAHEPECFLQVHYYPKLGIYNWSCGCSFQLDYVRQKIQHTYVCDMGHVPALVTPSGLPADEAALAAVFSACQIRA